MEVPYVSFSTDEDDAPLTVVVTSLKDATAPPGGSTRKHVSIL